MIKLVILLAVALLVLYVLVPARLFTPGRTLSGWMLSGVRDRFGGESEDEAARALVRRIGERVGRPAQGALPDLELSVVQSPQPNAFAVGVHHVCVTEGLLRLCDRREDLLAPVLAHEFGHIVAGHAAERFKQQAFGIGLGIAAAFVLRSPWLVRSTGLLRRLVLASFSRAQELEADACAIWMLDRAGYDPAALAQVLSRLDAWYRENLGHHDDPIGRFFSTHPPIGDRIRAIEDAYTPD